MNSEHYKDLTAETAIKNIKSKEQEKIKELKNWLNRSYKLQKKLERLAEKVARTRCIKLTPVYSSTPGNSNATGDNMTNMLIKIEDIQLKQKEVIEELVKVRKEITLVIFTIDNSCIRDVLMMRYLRYSPFRNIAKYLKVPRSTIHDRHQKGIKIILQTGH